MLLLSGGGGGGDVKKPKWLKISALALHLNLSSKFMGRSDVIPSLRDSVDKLTISQPRRNI